MNKKFEQIGIISFVAILLSSIYGLYVGSDAAWRICVMVWFGALITFSNLLSDILFEKNRKTAAYIYGVIRNSIIGTLLSLFTGMIERVNPALIVLLISVVVGAILEYYGYNWRWLKSLAYHYGRRKNH